MRDREAFQRSGICRRPRGLAVRADRLVAALAGERPEDVGEVLPDAQSAPPSPSELRPEVEQVEQRHRVTRGPFPIEHRVQIVAAAQNVLREEVPVARAGLDSCCALLDFAADALEQTALL